MILYYLTDDEGEHIMTAPLSTIAHFYRLHPDAIRRIEKETVSLKGICTLSFGSLYEGARVSRVHVRRLPEEIPSAPITVTIHDRR